MESKQYDYDPEVGVAIDKSNDRDDASNMDGEEDFEEEPVGIVEATQDFFFSDPSFAGDLEAWCKQHADQVDPEKEECALHYTKLYKQFLRLFEEKLSDFIETRGFTVEQFYEKLRNDVNDGNELFAEILNATIDFDVFLVMMKDVANQVNREKEFKAEHK